MNPVNLSLYLVLDPDLCGGLDGMVATTRTAVANGVTVVQLRAPQWKKRQWFDAAVALKAVLAGSGVPLVINDHVDIALAVDAEGVHVGQSDLPVAEVRRLVGPDKIVGLSTSNAAQLAAVPLALIDGGIDYIGVGPVYPTGTKKDASPVIAPADFAAMMLAKRCPAVAIGGIALGKVAPLIRAGADGVAVVSAICGQPDVAAATQALFNEITEARA
ncbi:thiamine phosphate synthase [Jeongeupia chitinilytica]|uniref:Thiamine-phosphate synthase n=1 Tax=Jeongeupia chitinilytica TaxID=1041641 RepID=A0ABQ3H2Z6_9NEIS|nr:thiamine phosphate synthase [Jeongeupia chitinilytica]GHD62403.1 thiamine phosphate synthase [Jeongeupia chitinilytica]